MDKIEPRKFFTTPKGTELPLLNYKGREYLEVKYRIVWMREEHPDWSIITSIVRHTENVAAFRAEILTPEGRVMATSHKFETSKGFRDYFEKAETGAIGRALALCGYGTQFCADELDEGDRIVDAPTEPPKPKTDDAQAFVDDIDRHLGVDPQPQLKPARKVTVDDIIAAIPMPPPKQVDTALIDAEAIKKIEDLFDRKGVAPARVSEIIRRVTGETKPLTKLTQHEGERMIAYVSNFSNKSKKSEPVGSSKRAR